MDALYTRCIAAVNVATALEGSRDGKAYRRELFEEAIGVLLDRVGV